MRRLTTLATLLYPSEWRRRYGVELQCLLEDSSGQGASGLRDVWDILKGGLLMRYTGTNIVRMAMTWGLTCGLLGLLISGVVAFSMPDRYRGESTLVGRVRGPQNSSAFHPASFAQFSAVVGRVMTDEMLARMIGAYGLYGHDAVADHPYQLSQDSSQDAAMLTRVAQFRRDVRILGRPTGVLVVQYSGLVAPLAAQVANQIASLIIEENLREAKENPATPDSFRITIVNPARVPEKPYRPNRLLISLDGLAGGALIGITIALLRRRPMQLAS